MSFSTFLIQLAIVLCIVIYATIYVVGIRRGTVRPILATWIFLSLATVLSFVTNFSETGAAGLLANSFNAIDTLATLTISVTVLCSKNVRKQFTGFEKGCLGAVLVIFLAWIASGQNVLAHLALQLILVIAYLPTLVHLWNAEKNSESFSMWFFDFVASALGVIEPLRTMTLLPLVYGIRAVISTLAVLVLIMRLQGRHKRLNSGEIRSAA